MNPLTCQDVSFPNETVCAIPWERNRIAWFDIIFICKRNYAFGGLKVFFNVEWFEIVPNLFQSFSNANNSNENVVIQMINFKFKMEYFFNCSMHFYPFDASIETLFTGIYETFFEANLEKTWSILYTEKNLTERKLFWNAIESLNKT